MATIKYYSYQVDPEMEKITPCLLLITFIASEQEQC